MSLWIAYELKENLGGIICMCSTVLPFLKYDKNRNFPLLFIFGSGKF